ncbi:MAG TPA: carboxypeptidase-like regulatory domain-containing protein [Pyrinomonadaceae bacterium]|nr:carboxypeptidase regulatory-like domain-containing protein [Chloracidobacterium sp.]HRJ90144.1 carboxypeptidase-like regulatory domain-containing protein [Pyrinomonadaceae bacterium]HRK49485.1 carboxypeptidase-like regulatory domain-containing protein [Pyrinomonadaceae bacterium]
MKRTRIALFIAFAVAAFFIYQFGLTEGLAFQVKRARLIVTDQKPESRRTELRDDKSAEQNIGKLGATPGQTNGLWVFGGSLIPNPISTLAGRDRLVNTSSQSGFTDLYVSVYQSTPNSSGRLMYQDDDMAALITAAHANGQEVWAAYGDPGFPALGCGSSFPMQRMAEVAAYNASRSLNERFDGVVLDIEPAEPMSEADFQAMLTQYQCFRDALPSSIKLATAIRFFWTTPVEYPVGETTRPAYEHIIDMNFDNVIVMGYRDFAGTSNCGVGDGIICRDQDEVAYATSLSRSGLILAGIETKDVSPGEPETITFFEEGQVSYHVEARKVARHFESSSGFGGFAVHNYSDTILSDIAGWPDTLTVGTCDTGQNVDVEASGGTLQAGYSTLGAAFAAINAGTHTGDIAVEICASLDEGVNPATLNSSGAGSATYSSIEIYPLSDGLTITGNPGNGFGIIQFNGSDNIAFDGDNPNTVGKNRNLTVINANIATGNYSSVVRVATSPVITSANNIRMQYLSLNGNATGRNVSGINGSTTAANTTFGVYVGGNGGNPATNAPTAITSVTTQGIATNSTVNDFVVSNNSISNCGRGVQFLGAEAAMSNSVTVSGNTIGNPTLGETSGVYSTGIAIQGSSGILIANNTIFVESFLSLALRGIDIGPIATNSAYGPAIVEKNRVERVKSNRELTQGAYGINISGGIGHSIRNNFVSGVINSQFGGFGGDLSPTTSAVGIRIGNGTDHQIQHNSVNLFGTVPGNAGFNMTTAFAISATGQLRLDVRNNVFSNQINGGSLAETRHVAIYLPSGATSTMNLTMNNNAYFQGNETNSRMARRGTSTLLPPEDEYISANFNAGATTPATNFRAYSSTLQLSGNNDNASFATTTAPPFVSNSDLHIPTAGSSQLNNGGAVTSVIDDIDGDVRGATPDIGADEIVAPTAAAVTVSGRVMTANGRGIGSTRVMFTGGNLTEPLTAVTNQFGYYHFEGIEAGQTYIITVGHKRYAFSEPSRVIELFDNLSDVDFVAVF